MGPNDSQPPITNTPSPQSDVNFVSNKTTATPISESTGASFEFLKNKVDEIQRYAETTSNLIKTDFQNLEKRQGDVNNILLWLTGTITVVFLVTFIVIVIDYSKNRGDGYKDFVDKVSYLEKDYYSKKEVDFLIKSFKECIWYNGLSVCLK